MSVHPAGGHVSPISVRFTLIDPAPGVSIYKKRRHTEAQTQRDGHVMTEAAMGEMRPQAKERQEPPAAGRRRKDSFLSPPEGAWSANVLIANIRPPEG